MATAIEFNNISKIYRLGLVSTGTLAHDLKRWWTMSIRGKEDPYLTIGETNDRSTKGESEYVWALKDIDFKVEQGDVVGIIGKNGAGKSTLLKILSKVTAPTTGTIRARGRIGSLLEVGTGFHPEMTGRENIYMNGTILGMTKAEVSKKLDEIIDFSGCERYIDTPVKRYSSGMMIRLGFAVAAHLDPEILVVDEVLAVGDAEFQKKAIGKMKDVSKGEGRTVLFVSHNMDAILNLCPRSILMSNGKIAFESNTMDVINTYLSNSATEYSFTNTSENDKVTIKKIEYIGTNDDIVDHYYLNEPVKIRTKLHRANNYYIHPNTVYSIIICRNGKRICTIEQNIFELNKGTDMEIEMSFPRKFFTPGNIYLETTVHNPNIEILDYANDICQCPIIDTGTKFIKYADVDCGVVLVNPEIKTSIFEK